MSTSNQTIVVGQPPYGLAIASAGALVDAVRDDAERIVRDAVVLARAVRENLSITTAMRSSHRYRC